MKRVNLGGGGKLGDVSALFLAFVLTQVSMVAAGTLSTGLFTGDSDIVNANVEYIYAFNYGTTAQTAATVNGITFSPVSGRTATGITSEHRYVYRSLSGNGITTNASSPRMGSLTGDAASLLSGFLYPSGVVAGETEQAIFSNLQEGKTYTLRLYTSAWTGTSVDSRNQTFSFDSNADGIADDFVLASDTTQTSVQSASIKFDAIQNTWYGTGAAPADNTSPYYVDYTFTAGSNTLHMFNTAGAADGWHNYAMALYEHTDVARVIADTPTIKNASFEVDTFYETTDGSHGRSSAYDHNGIITGWVLNKPGNTGLAPSWTDAARTTALCNDFLNGTSTVPEGDQALFLQSGTTSAAAADQTTITQEITGFNPGEYYVLTYSARKRADTGTTQQDVYLTVLTGDYSMQRTIANTEFEEYTRVFKATDEVQTIGFSARLVTTTGNADGSVLIDNLLLDPSLTLVRLQTTGLFRDTFAVGGGSTTDINSSGNDLAGRYSGKYTPPDNTRTYTSRHGNDSMSIEGSVGQYINHASAITHFGTGEMLTLETNSSSGNQRFNGITLRHDFADDYVEGGTMYHISFDVAPFYADGSGNVLADNTHESWGAVIFGGSENGIATVNSNDGVGILVRQNGGVQIFDKNNTMIFNLGNAVEDNDGWYNFEIDFWVSEFGNGEDVDIDLLINGVSFGFTVEGGFDENFVTLMAQQNSGVTGTYYSYFDNFTISASAVGDPSVPEPATWLMLLLGAMALAARRIRRKH